MVAIYHFHAIERHDAAHRRLAKFSYVTSDGKI